MIGEGLEAMFESCKLCQTGRAASRVTTNAQSPGMSFMSGACGDTSVIKVAFKLRAHLSMNRP